MMEGIGSEAASLAAHLGLDNLCWIYGINRITIEGHTNVAFTEDVAARFLAYGWSVLRVGDANDVDRIERALDVFKKETGRPTFIVLDSHIGYGSPHKQEPAEAQALLPYSARRASIGEMRLALSAGINEARNADNPNAATAVSATKGSYGFIP